MSLKSYILKLDFYHLFDGSDGTNIPLWWEQKESGTWKPYNSTEPNFKNHFVHILNDFNTKYSEKRSSLNILKNKLIEFNEEAEKEKIRLIVLPIIEYDKNHYAHEQERLNAGCPTIENGKKDSAPGYDWILEDESKRGTDQEEYLYGDKISGKPKINQWSFALCDTSNLGWGKYINPDTNNEVIAYKKLKCNDNAYWEKNEVTKLKNEDITQCNTALKYYKNKLFDEIKAIENIIKLYEGNGDENDIGLIGNIQKILDEMEEYIRNANIELGDNYNLISSADILIQRKNEFDDIKNLRNNNWQEYNEKIIQLESNIENNDFKANEYEILYSITINIINDIKTSLINFRENNLSNWKYNIDREIDLQKYYKFNEINEKAYKRTKNKVIDDERQHHIKIAELNKQKLDNFKTAILDQSKNLSNEQINKLNGILEDNRTTFYQKCENLKYFIDQHELRFTTSLDIEAAKYCKYHKYN